MVPACLVLLSFLCPDALTFRAVWQDLPCRISSWGLAGRLKEVILGSSWFFGGFEGWFSLPSLETMAEGSASPSLQGQWYLDNTGDRGSSESSRLQTTG